MTLVNSILLKLGLYRIFYSCSIRSE